jgi:hypothetical protein
MKISSYSFLYLIFHISWLFHDLNTASISINPNVYIHPFKINASNKIIGSDNNNRDIDAKSGRIFRQYDHASLRKSKGSSDNNNNINTNTNTNTNTAATKSPKTDSKVITTKTKMFRTDNLYNNNAYIIEIQDEAEHAAFIDSEATNNFVIVVYYGKSH